MNDTNQSARRTKREMVTVAIPAFRARNYIVEALESVRQQGYPSWEIIVVDDCSPEPVDDLVNTFAATVPNHSVRLIRHSKNSGPSATRNTAILAANGEYVAFLDHDDVWREDHLEDAMAAIELEPADLAYCDFELFQERPGDLPNEATYGPERWGPFPESLYNHNFIPPSSVVMRKSALEQLGLFAELRACEDLDLWLRAAGYGCKFVRVPKRNLLYRKHPASATNNPRNINAAKAHVLCCNVGTVSEVPLAYRRHRACTVCAEAARAYRTDEPLRTAHFYFLSFRTDPSRLKHLCAALYYLILGFLNPAKKRRQLG